MIIYIAALNGDGGQGGVERVVSQQKRVLQKLNHTVILADKNYFRLTRVMANKKILVLLYPLLVSVYFLFKKFFGHKFTVISHGYSSPFYSNDLLIAHGNMKCYSQTIMKTNLRLLSGSGVIAFYEKCAGRFSKKIWAVSRRVKREWIEYYIVEPNKINVVRNYIDLNKFNEDEVAVQRYITFVGRLEKGKGIAELIEICSAHPGLQFNLVSSIPAPEELNVLNNVTFSIGVPYESMPQVFKEAKLLILPSMYEGFELVTVEALCCGTPVVGYDVGAISELYSDMHPGVFMVENKDELISMIGHVINQPDADYLKLRRDIYDRRDVFSENHYEDIMKKAFENEC